MEEEVDIFEGFSGEDKFMYKRFMKQLIRFMDKYENLELNTNIYRRVNNDDFRFLIMFEDKQRRLKTCLCMNVRCWWAFVKYGLGVIQLNDSLHEDILTITEKIVVNLD